MYSTLDTQEKIKNEKESVDTIIKNELSESFDPLKERVQTLTETVDRFSKLLNLDQRGRVTNGLR